MRSLLLIVLLASFTPYMNAQRMASAPPRFARNFHHGGHARRFFDSMAFYDPFYSDYLSSTEYSAQAPVIVVQTPPVAPAPERPPSEPLTIELQGDRYVRLSGEEASGLQIIDPMPTASRRQDRSAVGRIQPLAPEES